MTDAVAVLYRLDPESFTAARDALAKELKANGDLAAAAAVKALRRPSVAAWLLNLTALEHPEAVAAVLELARRLRAAQSDAMSGRGADSLRSLGAERRRVVGHAVQTASQVAQARGRGVSPAVVDAMTGTVEAALADPDLADRWQAARLVTAEQAIGFSFGPADFETGDVATAGTGDAKPSTPNAVTVKAAQRVVEDSDVEDSDAADLRQGLARARDNLASASAEVERQRASADEAKQSARLARLALKDALRAQAKAELTVATAEQAVWEVADRSRREE